MKLNTMYSKQIALEKKPIPQECFYNASTSLTIAMDRYGENCEYVEGLVVGSLFIYEHAWIQVDDEIIDSTLPDDAGHIYFPVNKYSLNKMVKYIVKNRGRLPIFKYDNQDKKRILMKRSELQEQYPERLTFDGQLYCD
jgi:hypothetical protein